jgi:hypothetical protein
MPIAWGDEMASVMTGGGIPFGTQIRRVAEAEPDAVAIVFAAEDVS